MTLARRFARRFACLCAAVAVVLALACGREVTPTGPSASEPPRLVAVLGDSLSVSPSTDESFPAVLGRRLAAEWPGWTVLNSGVNGDTTSGGLARLNTVLGQRPQVLILALGANDGLRGVPTGTIEAQLAVDHRAFAGGLRAGIVDGHGDAAASWARLQHRLSSHLPGAGAQVRRVARPLPARRCRG